MCPWAAKGTTRKGLRDVHTPPTFRASTGIDRGHADVARHPRAGPRSEPLRRRRRRPVRHAGRLRRRRHAHGRREHLLPGRRDRGCGRGQHRRGGTVGRGDADRLRRPPARDPDAGRRLRLHEHQLLRSRRRSGGAGLRLHRVERHGSVRVRARDLGGGGRDREHHGSRRRRRAAPRLPIGRGNGDRRAADVPGDPGPAVHDGDDQLGAHGARLERLGGRGPRPGHERSPHPRRRRQPRRSRVPRRSRSAARRGSRVREHGHRGERDGERRRQQGRGDRRHAGRNGRRERLSGRGRGARRTGQRRRRGHRREPERQRSEHRRRRRRQRRGGRPGRGRLVLRTSQGRLRRRRPDGDGRPRVPRRRRRFRHDEQPHLAPGRRRERRRHRPDPDGLAGGEPVRSRPTARTRTTTR